MKVSHYKAEHLGFVSESWEALPLDCRKQARWWQWWRSSFFLPESLVGDEWAYSLCNQSTWIYRNVQTKDKVKLTYTNTVREYCMQKTMTLILQTQSYLYGIWGACSTSAVMTRPRVSRLWLMLPASRARLSTAPERPMFSLPAKST